MRVSILTALLASLLTISVAVAQDMSNSSSEEAATLSTSEPSVPSETPSSSTPSPDMSRSTEPSSSVPLPTEPEVEPVAPLELLQAIFDVCIDVASGDPEALDRAQGAGWEPGEEEYGGPYRTIHSGFRPFDGYDGASYRALTDLFPSQRLGYCSGSIGDVEERIDIALFSSIAGLTGGVTSEDGGLYGTWETPDHKVMVFAGHAEGYVDYEINILLGPAPAP